MGCVRRDPWPSVIAGIVDTYGGIRFVVTYPASLKHHARHDEIIIVVPNITVHEPVAWNDIPGLIARVEYEVTLWLDRGEPNEPHAREAWKMYKLRRQEQPGKSLNLYDIVET